VTSAWLTGLPSPASQPPACPCSSTDISDFGRGRRRSGTFPPQPLPLCEVLCKRDQPSETDRSLWPSITPQNLPEPMAGRSVGNRSLCREDAVGLKGRLDANQCLIPACPPGAALSSALEATSSFGFLLFILHLLNDSSFQGHHLLNAVITGGVEGLLPALYSANIHFPHSTAIEQPRCSTFWVQKAERGARQLSPQQAGS